MMQYTGIPDMGHAQLFDPLQGGIGNIIKFANTVLLNSTPGLIGLIGITKQPGKHLIKNYLPLLTTGQWIKLFRLSFR